MSYCIHNSSKAIAIVKVKPTAAKVSVVAYHAYSIRPNLFNIHIGRAAYSSRVNCNIESLQSNDIKVLLYKISDYVIAIKCDYFDVRITGDIENLEITQTLPEEAVEIGAY